MIFAFIEWSINPEFFHFGPLSLRWYNIIISIFILLIYSFITRKQRKNNNEKLKKKSKKQSKSNIYLFNLLVIVFVVALMAIGLSIFLEYGPTIINFGVISVRYYGFLFAMAFVAGFFIMTRIFNKEGRPQADLEQLSVYMILGTVIGARLGHCLFYNPTYYLSNPIEILKVWEGGLASHGAAIGILIAIYLFSNKKKNYSMLWILDRIVIVVALAGTLIRLGNLFNSEIIGIPTDVSWAFIFTAVDNIPRHPAQLYESIAYLIIFIILWFVYYKGLEKNKSGLIFGLFLVLVFTFRFFVEFLKETQSGFEKSMILDMGQILSIPFIIAGIIFIAKSFQQKAKK